MGVKALAIKKTIEEVQYSQNTTPSSQSLFSPQWQCLYPSKQAMCLFSLPVTSIIGNELGHLFAYMLVYNSAY